LKARMSRTVTGMSLAPPCVIECTAVIRLEVYAQTRVSEGVVTMLRVDRPSRGGW
jgi:hypothetical protein